MEPAASYHPEGLGRNSLQEPSLSCCVQYSSFALCTEINLKYSMTAEIPLNVEPTLGQDVLPIFDAGV